MDRREFLGFCAGLGLLITGFATRETKSYQDREVLEDFLTYDITSFLTKEDIEESLYDISRIYEDEQHSTVGRAVHIGGNYFLTSYHVIDENPESLRLLKQEDRFFSSAEKKEFTIETYDSIADIALIKVNEENNETKAKVHLDALIPSLNHPVSTFIRISRRPSDQTYDFSYDGVDFFDKSEEIKNLGRLILPAGSLLFERQGKILKIDEDRIGKFKGRLSHQPKYYSFSSISGTNGYSGQPIFVKVGEEQHVFTGILHGFYGIKKKIPTPGNPLGYDGIQQTGAVFTHREPIAQMIKTYIEHKLS